MSVASLRREAASERPDESMTSSQAKLQSPSATNLSKVPRGSTDSFINKLRTRIAPAKPSTAGINAALAHANTDKVAASTPTLYTSAPEQIPRSKVVSRSTAKLSGAAVDGTDKAKSSLASASQPSLQRQNKQQSTAKSLAPNIAVRSSTVLKSNGSILYDDDAAAKAVEAFEREEDEAALEALNAFEQERGENVRKSIPLNSKETGSINDVRKSSGSLLYDDEAAEQALYDFEHQNLKSQAPEATELTLTSATLGPVNIDASDVYKSNGSILYDDDAAREALEAFQLEQEKIHALARGDVQREIDPPKSSGIIGESDEDAPSAIRRSDIQDQAADRLTHRNNSIKPAVSSEEVEDVSSNELSNGQPAKDGSEAQLIQYRSNLLLRKIKAADAAIVTQTVTTSTTTGAFDAETDSTSRLALKGNPSLNNIRNSAGDILYDDEAALNALEQFEQDQAGVIRQNQVDQDISPPSVLPIAATELRSSITDVRNSAGNLLYDDEAASKALQEFEQERAPISKSIHTESLEETVTMSAPAQSINDVRKSSGSLLYDDDAATKALDEFEHDHERRTSVRFQDGIEAPIKKIAPAAMGSINDVRKSTGSLLYDDEAASKALEGFEQDQKERTSVRFADSSAAPMAKIASTITASINDVRKSSGSLLYDDEAASKALDDFEQDQKQRTTVKSLDNDVAPLIRIAAAATASINDVRKSSGSLLYDDEAASNALDEFEQDQTRRTVRFVDGDTAPITSLASTNTASINDVRKSSGSLLNDDEAASKALEEFEQDLAKRTTARPVDAEAAPIMRVASIVTASINDVRKSSGSLLYDDDAASKALEEFEQDLAQRTTARPVDADAAPMMTIASISINDVRRSSGSLLYDDEAASKALDDFEQDQKQRTLKSVDDDAAPLMDSAPATKASINDVCKSSGSLLYDDEAASKTLDDFEHDQKQRALKSVDNDAAPSINDVRKSSGSLLYDDEAASKALDEFEQDQQKESKMDAKLDGSMRTTTGEISTSADEIRKSSGSILYDDEAASKVLEDFEQDEIGRTAGKLKDGYPAASVNDVRTSSGSLLYDDDAATKAIEEFERDHGKTTTANLKSTTSMSKMPTVTTNTIGSINDVRKSSGSLLYDDEAASRALDEFEHENAAANSSRKSSNKPLNNDGSVSVAVAESEEAQKTRPTRLNAQAPSDSNNESDVRRSSNRLSEDSGPSEALPRKISSDIVGQLGSTASIKKSSPSVLSDGVAPSKAFEEFEASATPPSELSRDSQPQQTVQPQSLQATRRENLERAESQNGAEEEPDRLIHHVTSVKPTVSSEEVEDVSSTELSNAQPATDGSEAQLIQYRSNLLLRKIKAADAESDRLIHRVNSVNPTVSSEEIEDVSSTEQSNAQLAEDDSNAQLIQYRSNLLLRKIKAADAESDRLIHRVNSVDPTVSNEEIEDVSSTEQSNSQPAEDDSKAQLIQYRSNLLLRKIKAADAAIATQTVTTSSTTAGTAYDADANEDEDTQSQELENAALIRYQSNTFMRRIMAAETAALTGAQDASIHTSEENLHNAPTENVDDALNESLEGLNEQQLINYMSNPFLRRIAAREIEDVRKSQGSINSKSEPLKTDQRTPLGSKDSLSREGQGESEFKQVQQIVIEIKNQSTIEPNGGSENTLVSTTSLPKSGSAQVAVTKTQVHPTLGSIQRLEAALEEDAAEMDRYENFASLNNSAAKQTTGKIDKDTGDVASPQISQMENQMPIATEDRSHPTEDHIQTLRDGPTNMAGEDTGETFDKEDHVPSISIQPETTNDEESQPQDAQAERLPTADDSFRLQPNDDFDDNVSNLELPLAEAADSRADLGEYRDEEFYSSDTFSDGPEPEVETAEEPSAYDDEEFDVEEQPTTDEQQNLGEGNGESDPSDRDVSQLQAAKAECETLESGNAGELSHVPTDRAVELTDSETQYADDFTKASLEDFFGPDLDDTYREAHERETVSQMPSEGDQQQIEEPRIEDAQPNKEQEVEPKSQYLTPLPPSGQRPLTGRQRGRSRPLSAVSSSSSFDEAFHSPESITTENTENQPLSEADRKLSLESKGALGRRKSRPMAANIAKRRSRGDISPEAMAVDQNQPLASDVVQDVPVGHTIASGSQLPRQLPSPSLELLNVEPARASSVATLLSSLPGSVSSLPRLQAVGTSTTSLVARQDRRPSKRDAPVIDVSTVVDASDSHDALVGQLQQEVKKLKTELHSRDAIMTELLRRESLIGNHFDEAVPEGSGDNGGVNVSRRLALHSQRRAFQIVIGRLRQEINYLKFKRNSPYDPVRDTERLPYLARGDTAAAKNVISSQNHAHFANSAIHKSKASRRTSLPLPGSLRTASGEETKSLEAIGRPMTAKHGDGDGPEQFTAEERERRKVRHRAQEQRGQEQNQKDHPADARMRGAVVGESVEERIRSSPLNKGYHRHGEVSSAQNARSHNKRSKSPRAHTAASKATSDVVNNIPIIPPTDTEDQSEQRLRQGVSIETGSIKNGERVMVVVDGQRRLGIVKYVGWFDAQPDSTVWLGIALDDAVGRHDGVILGKRYFTCLDRHGFFCKADKAVLMRKDFRMPKTAVPRHPQKEDH